MIKWTLLYIVAVAYLNGQAAFAQVEQSTAGVGLGLEIYDGINVHAGLTISDDVAVEAFGEVNGRQICLTCGCADSANEVHSDRIAGFRARRFFGKSFNGSAFLYGRRLRSGCEYPDNEGSIDEQESIGVGLAAGNRWQFQHFYVGAEWFGVAIERETELDNNLTYGRVLFLRFVVGLSF